MPADAILQLQNHSFTRRLLAYFDARPGQAGPLDGPTLAVWPPGDRHGVAAASLGACGPTAKPPGPHDPHTQTRGSHRSAGGLLLVTGIEATADEFKAWVRSTPPLARALSRLYWFEEGQELPRAASGAGLIDVLMARFPSPPDYAVRVMATPRPLQAQLMDALDGAGWTLAPTSAGAVLTAVDAGDGRGLRAALVPPDSVLNDTTPERARGGAPSRALAKLTEAVAVLGVRLDGVAAAIDVGAAPGGWTAALADAGVGAVVAVDPADMDAAVLARRGVVHVRALSDGAADAVRAALPDGALADLLLCDANAAPKQAARALVPLVPLLRPGGVALFTVKCVNGGYGDNKAFAARVAREILEPAGLAFRTSLWLVANTLAERTLVLVRRGEGAALLPGVEE